MLRPSIALLLLFCLSGCGHMLAGMEVETIEEDEGSRTWGRMLEDDSIETKARVNIHAADEAFDDAHLNIISYNGYVLLAGQVQSEALKSKATATVKDIRGVRRIYNELEISAPSSGMTTRPAFQSMARVCVGIFAARSKYVIQLTPRKPPMPGRM